MNKPTQPSGGDQIARNWTGHGYARVIERRFTLETLERLTPDLTAAGRLAVFLGLSDGLSAEATASLKERVEARTRRQFAEHRVGEDATPEEIAAEIAAIWPEIQAVPLGATKRDPEPNHGHHHHRGGGGSDSDDDVLKTISPILYFRALVGVDVPEAGGTVLCPVHDERTPSCHVYPEPERGWHCFGCGAGGSIYDLGSALWNISTRGPEFKDLQRELSRVLLGTVTE